MHAVDFQPSARTSSRWLSDEIVKGAPPSPLPMATLAFKSNPELDETLGGGMSGSETFAAWRIAGDATCCQARGAA